MIRGFSFLGNFGLFEQQMFSFYMIASRLSKMLFPKECFATSAMLMMKIITVPLSLYFI